MEANLEFKSNDQSVLEVTASGIPAPTVTWSKDRITLVEAENLRSEMTSEVTGPNQTTFRLKINSSASEDSGAYIATVKNQLGQVTSQTKVNILSGPKFSKELCLLTCSPQCSESKTDQYNQLSVNQKSVLKIECQINALPKPVIKWFRNEIELQTNEKTKLENKGDNYFLTIKDCNPKDKGLYTVRAENNCGISVSKLFIDINSIPVIVKGISNSEVVLSESDQVYEFLSTYQSKPKADVVWLLSDKPIPLDDHYSVLEESTVDESGTETFVSKLKIQNLAVSDAGAYKCKLKNCVGETVSTGTLSILKGQLFTVKLAPLLELKEKNEIKLECKIDDSNPKSTVSWLKDSNPIAASKRILISKPTYDQETNTTVCSLTIQDAIGTDSGVYTVKSVSKIATIESSCEVNVLSAPKITKDLKPTLQSAAGDKVSLDVTATGKPDPEFKWFCLNNETETEIISSETVTISKTNTVYSLSFAKITRDHKGKYILRLSNNAGQAEASCNVLVDDCPVIIKQLEDLNVSEGSECAFTVTADGTPTPTCEWYLQIEHFMALINFKIKI